MILPVRVGLRVGIDGPACSFTAHLKFKVRPHKGDKILLHVPSQGQVGVSVVEVYHFVSASEKPVALILCTPLILDHYDGMLATLDWFKATYSVEDCSSDEEPELYYKFYRNLIHVLGLTKVASPVVQYTSDDIRVFAEACRAVLLAELKPTDDELPMAISGFNPTIKHLHELVLSRRQEEPDGANMLNIVKVWEQLFNQKKLMQWDAPIDRCLNYAKLVFARLRSLPSSKLPEFLRSPLS